MSTTAESAAACCAILDNAISDSEFYAQVQRNKLLHDCKTKGFKGIESLGLIRKPAKREVKVVTLSNEDFATMGAAMVNGGKMTIAAFCDQHGRNPGDLRYYCKKFGIELVRRRDKKTTHDHKAIYRRTVNMINRHGYRMSDVSKKLKASPALIKKVLECRGMVYNAKTIKLEKAK